MKVVICVVVLGILGQVWCDDCPSKVVACYYSSWAIYREDDGKFTINDIDPSLCTHLIYSFAGLDLNSRIGYLDYSNDITYAGYTTFTALKEKNPCLKTMLAVGGWNEGSAKYSVMTSTDASRIDFAESALRFLAAYNFDGLDIDWEYPTQRGGIAEDKDNFVALLKYLRPRLDKWGKELSIAVPLSTDIADMAYDMEEIEKYVDHIYLMAYDYTATNSKETGLLAPMSAIQSSVKQWINRINSEKLVLGLPTYGRNFRLLDPDSNEIGAETNGSAYAGEFTKEAGFLAYYELSDRLSTDMYTIVPSDGTYYAYYSTDWLSFDLKDSYQAKVQYALDNNLGGVMLWSIDTEDFRGLYNETSFPILNAVHEILNNYKL